MAIQELPSEILQNIFNNIDHTDLHDILYICKKWHFMVKIDYLQNINFRGVERIQKLKEHLSTLTKEAQSIQPLSMTKQLSIANEDELMQAHLNYNPTSLKLTKEQFLLLLSLFPNLKTLDIGESTYKDHYMKILGDCELQKMPPLEEIVMNYIEYEDWDQEEERALRFAVYRHFRQSIKRLDIICIEAREKKFIRSLADFTSLKTLDLHNDSDPDVTIFSLFQACPNLSYLSYCSNFSIPANAAQQLTKMIQDMKGRPISHFLKYLKVMKLFLPTLTTPYIDFIINHIPKSLNDIEIKQSLISLDKWIDVTTLDVTLNLCKSLQKLSTVRLAFINEGAMNGEKIDLFYQILGELTGNREFHNCSALHKARLDVDHVGVDIRIAESNLSYQYYVGREDHGRNIATPSDLSQLSKVNTFKISTVINNPYSLPKNYLDHVKKHCPRLTRFHVCDYKWDYFLKAECLDLSKPSIYNMTHITLDRVQYTQKLVDDLMDYFPKTKVLNFGVDGLHTETTNIRFNLLKFKCLHTLIIKLQIGPRSPPGSFFLRYMNNKRRLSHYSLENYVEWRRHGDKNENSFRFISADDMQEGLQDEKMKNKFAIHVEGQQQLVKIKLMIGDRTYAKVHETYAKIDL